MSKKIPFHNKKPRKWHIHATYKGSHSYLQSPNFDKFLLIHLFCELSSFCVLVAYPQNYVFYWLCSDF